MGVMLVECWGCARESVSMIVHETPENIRKYKKYRCPECLQETIDKLEEEIRDREIQLARLRRKQQ